MEKLIELRQLIRRHALPDRSTAIPILRLMAVEQPTELIHHLCQPTFGLVAQGSKRVLLGDTWLEHKEGQSAVVSAYLPLASQVVFASPEQPFLAAAVMLQPEAITSLLLEVARPQTAVSVQSAFGFLPLSSNLLDPMVRLVQLLEHPQDHAVLVPLIEREIIWRLLQGEQADQLRQIGLRDSRMDQISQAIHWIREHHHERLQIEALARQVSMSTTSFHRHFRAFTGLSPLQYQKQIRLQKARARLLAGEGDVAAVGFAVGYDSPSQFSREYSRLFGAPPGRDVAELRSSSGAQVDITEYRWV